MIIPNKLNTKGHDNNLCICRIVTFNDDLQGRVTPEVL